MICHFKVFCFKHPLYNCLQIPVIWSALNSALSTSKCHLLNCVTVLKSVHRFSDPVPGVRGWHHHWGSTQYLLRDWNQWTQWISGARFSGQPLLRKGFITTKTCLWELNSSGPFKNYETFIKHSLNENCYRSAAFISNLKCLKCKELHLNHFAHKGNFSPKLSTQVWYLWKYMNILIYFN